MKCSICKKEIQPQKTSEGVIFWDKGHNAEPITEGRCCSDCNFNKVIPARMSEMGL